MRSFWRRIFRSWNRTNWHPPAAPEYSEDDVEQMRIANQTFVMAVPVGPVVDHSAARSKIEKHWSMFLSLLLGIRNRSPNREIDPAPMPVEVLPVLEIHFTPMQSEVNATPEVFHRQITHSDIYRYPESPAFCHPVVSIVKKTSWTDNEDVSQTSEEAVCHQSDRLADVWMSQRHERFSSVDWNDSELSSFEELFLSGQLGIGCLIEGFPPNSAYSGLYNQPTCTMPPAELLVSTSTPTNLRNLVVDVTLPAGLADAARRFSLSFEDFLTDEETEAFAKRIEYQYERNMELKCREKDDWTAIVRGNLSSACECEANNQL